MIAYFYMNKNYFGHEIVKEEKSILVIKLLKKKINHNSSFSTNS